MPSGPGALCLAFWRKVRMSFRVGRVTFENSHGVQNALAKVWACLVLIVYFPKRFAPVVAEFFGFLLGRVGSGAVEPYDADID
jgi:hypothetical protein